MSDDSTKLPAPKFDPDFKPCPDICIRFMDTLATCSGMGNAIRIGEIEPGVEILPLTGQIVWRFMPGVSSLPSFGFCPFCGERIAYP